MPPRPTTAAIRIVDIDSDLRPTATADGYSVWAALGPHD